MEKLREYVRAVMDKEGISVPDIVSRSEGTIKQSYIFDILSGKTKSISVEKLNALAKGLDIDPVELFKIASGYTPSPDPAREMTAVLKIILGMSSKERSSLLTYLKKK
jgi:transcriptional regulator with XRE-family HTH domain